ncbi:MAG: flagellar protein FlgN [Candidatus Melainabacteria bacterium]
MTTTETPQTMDALKALLRQETETYQQVADALSHKTSVLVNGDYHGLAGVDQELVRLGQKSIQLETQRMAAMTAMGYENHTLRQLIEVLPPDEKKPLQTLRENLLEKVFAVQTANQQHQSLLDLSIQWVGDTMDIIAKALTPEGASYTGTGKSVKGAPGQTPIQGLQSTISRDA